MPNRLARESSPYLLQHANNPVEWFPWGQEALAKAEKENKLILVSIGYSACHWCHVMEHESFEDGQVAEVMNRYFVCIKIDREERPDIDQIYMNAVQLMTERGGWPLNCFCLPDQRPVYGGTYFPKKDWVNLLLNLAEFWREKPQEAIQYAEKLTEGIRQSEQLVINKDDSAFSKDQLTEMFDVWKRSFDMSEGGYNRAPKFPLPNNWVFMLRYAHLMSDQAARIISKLTLEKMAMGGIYDQIGGGFARYSVDDRWHVPHFEKMLYDNAQLVSLYAEAYQFDPDELYKKVVYETLEFVRRELTSPQGGFYSALDADSEGVEGKFYTYTKEELRALLGDDEELFSIYFHLTEDGNWEEEQTNIFLRKFDDVALAAKLGLSVKELTDKISSASKRLFEHRSQRVPPNLDNKILASWNGMMLKAYTDAYRVFNKPEFLEEALRNAEFLIKNMVRGDQLVRVYKTDSNPGSEDYESAFLDDYAFVIEGLISLYEATFNERWLLQAQAFTDHALMNFFDNESAMMFYTSIKGEQLIARKQEIFDNVMPSSNSTMANNLFKLGHFFDDREYLDKAAQMLKNVQPFMKAYGSGYSNWGILLLNEVFGIYEIAITGDKAEARREELEKYYIPNKILLGGNEGSLPLLQDKWGDKTRIFVCQNRTCQMPVEHVDDALKQIT
ncbi:thioredoxin domain-containing protein [Flavihumibacter sp. R14]|nr:thioredoxin domain-containing protein [Flavihumibacter soli]